MIKGYTLPITAAGLALILLATLPSAVNIVRSLGRKGKVHRNGLYQDEDGTATEESQKVFSAKPPTLAICLTSVCGLVLSLANAVLTESNGSHHRLRRSVEVWLHCAIWALLVIQSVNISIERDPPRRFDFSQAAACSYLILIVILGFLEAQLRVTGAYMGLVTGESCLAIIAFAACLALPRRPDVYYEGKIVDRQWGLPAFHRYTYSWAAPLLKAGAAGKALAISDLPKMDHYTR